MKTLIERVLYFLSSSILSLQNKLHRADNTQTIIINTLAPRVLTEQADLDRVKPYLDSLKSAIDAKGINNIAVTGSYGSGKSTILKTFQHRNPQYEFLNISLASFSDNKEDKEEFERKLEISILQQMFYHVKPSDIPDSRFKRIINITNKHLAVHSILFIAWIFSCLVLFTFEYINKLNPSTWYLDYKFDFIAFFSSVIFFTGIGFFVKTVYRLVSNSKINKFNIKGEIELGEAVDKSVFNQHLEEILYFFERKKYDVVVIEDVDRFKSTDIFTKLREINILINSSKLINRPVKFVYAIKDEMFSNKNERVKFFEFIIPVIPFINPGNANDQLEKLINGVNLQGQLSPDFTSDIVTFIDDIDMRLLINIFQEYQIYRQILSPSLSQDKLFAILVYKNIYPDDFGELSKRNGKLYRFFSHKKEYLLDLNNTTQAKIDCIDIRISLLEKEGIPTIEELRAIYINRLVAKLVQFQSFSLGYQVSISDAVKDEFFNSLTSDKEFNYFRYAANYNAQITSQNVPSNIKLSDIEKEVNPNMSYLQREKLLKEKVNGQLEVLKKERDQLVARHSEIDSLSIQEIFKNKDITPYLLDFDNSYLMRSLLLNGYIDEHYEHYTTLFHGVSITQADFEFERFVKSGIKSSPDYKLSRIDNLIKKLPPRDFKREAIWNYDLLDYLLNNEIKYSEKLDLFLISLFEDSQKQFQFIHSYVKSSHPCLGKFVRKITEVKPGLWQYIASKSGLPAEEIRNWIVLLFEHSSIESLNNLQSLKTLDSYIAQLPDFFGFCTLLSQENSITTFLAKRNIRIEKLDSPSQKQTNLFQFIYAGNYYRLNEHNIVTIITTSKVAYDSKQFATSQFTTIKQLGLNDLLKYIASNMEDYVTNVMTTTPTNKNESDSVVVDILNSENLSIEAKLKILKNNVVYIKRLSDVQGTEMKKLALESGKVLSLWKNIFDYLDSSPNENLDDTLIKFLNDPSKYKQLSKEKMLTDDVHNKDYVVKISGLIIHSNLISLDAYAHLVNSIPYIYSSVNFGELEKNRIEKLLDRNKLSLSNENFAGLKAIDFNLSLRLVSNHQNLFLSEFSNLPIDADDWEGIFRSGSITPKVKMQMLSKIDDSIIITNSSVADVFCAIWPIDNSVPMRYEVLLAMFGAHASVKRRIELLLGYINNFDDEQVVNLVSKLGSDYAKLFESQGYATFKNDPYNMDLIKILINRKKIKRYKLEDKDTLIRTFANLKDSES